MSIRLDDIKDPRLRARIENALGAGGDAHVSAAATTTRKSDAVPEPDRPLLNKTETRWCSVLEGRGYEVIKQAITLRMDKPFTSYRPDLAVLEEGKLVFWEVKAPHRFARAGIAKADCASKTYPCFTFRLAMWTKSGWKESVLS